MYTYLRIVKRSQTDREFQIFSTYILPITIVIY